MRNKPELLAPAGDMERLRTAIRFGADSVYLGGPMLQLRSNSAGFSEERLGEAVEYAHGKGKKVYVAVNSFVRNSELKLLPDYAGMLYSLGADAVIVSDIGAICTIKEAVPDLEIHISTQANCINYASAKHYWDMGARRVVLGRETTLEEIREIRAEIPKEMEIECFIHGAMCMAYSGRCLLSAYMNGRSANQGDCSQPCRYRYRLDESEHGFAIEEDKNGTTILSSRDLNTIDFVQDIIDAGADSLKIEGRMKSTYYVATVTNAYRKRIDGSASAEACRRELDCASHRDYTSGFYFNEAKLTPSASADYMQDCTFTAMVLGEENGRYIIEQRNNFSTGDTFELLSPLSTGESFVLKNMEDLEGNRVDYAPHPMQKLIIEAPVRMSAGDILRRRNRTE